VLEEHGEGGVASGRPAGVPASPSEAVVDAAELRNRELLQPTPTMPATVIAERPKWPHLIRVLGQSGSPHDQTRFRHCSTVTQAK
jgi:hypothetical protein